MLVRSRLKRGDRMADIGRDLGVSGNVIYDLKKGVTYKKL
jgi:hypothetical protein